MRIAIASHNPVKLAAAGNALRRLFPEVEVAAVDADPGVSASPRSDEEAITGARNRARGAWETSGFDLGVGLEGGTTTIAGRHMTGGWCALYDGAGFSLGGGGHILLPREVDRLVDGEGRELGHAMDALTGGTNTKQKIGAIGILTGGLSNRRKAYEDIVAYSLVPLISPELFPPRVGGSQLKPAPRGAGAPDAGAAQTVRLPADRRPEKIAVGSGNPLKLRAVKKVLAQMGENIEVVAVPAESGVSHTPQSNEETIAGAARRAREAKKTDRAAWGIGLEGGMARFAGTWFSGVWCVITDGNRSFPGGGVHFQLPPHLVERIVKNKEEMGPCLDEISGVKTSKKKMGAEGILTKGLLDRENTLAAAFRYALAPFLHPGWYGL